MIKIVGLGPGHKAYVLPIAIEAIKKADLVIGAKRHLQAIEAFTSNTMDYSKGFEEIQKVLINHKDKTIVFAVSGDVGFYSMLDFVKRQVKETNIEVIPGISSLQYFYSKLGFGYEQSTWLSLHGRDYDLTDCICKEKELGILLDTKQNNQYIANEFKQVRAKLKKLKVEKCKMPVFYVGEKLSYDDEKISRLTIEECINYKVEDLSVVIIRYE